MRTLFRNSACLAVFLLVVLAPDLRAADPAPKTSEVAMFPLETKGAQAMRERLRLDLAAARGAVLASAMPEAGRQKLLDRIREIEARIEALPAELPAGFRTIMPFNEVQAAIFALNAPVLRAKGFPVLSAWTNSRWDILLPMQAPDGPQPPPALTVAVMGGEYRSAAFNLTNAGDAPLRVRLSLRGLPGGDNPAWVSVREVLFTDTYIHVPIAAALPEAPRVSGGFAVTIPAGMTRQVWLIFHPVKTAAGTYRGEVVLDGDGVEPFHIPLQVRRYSFELPTESPLSIGGWDYTHRAVSAYDAGKLDQKTYIRFLRDYGVNTPWADGILQEGCAFDATGKMTSPPDFAIFDQWIAKWKGARSYAIFMKFEDRFCGEPMGTPRFKRMVGDWVTSLVNHAGRKGIAPERLILLLVDEPLKPEQDAMVIPYAEAIRAVQPKVVLFEDPCHEDPAKVDPRMYESCDILCPNAVRFIGSPQSYRDFFAAQHKAGRTLWFYSCTNGKHLDPVAYWRGQSWLAIRYGATGSFYWAFGDEGGSGSSFRAYTSPGHMFSPLFLDPEMGMVDSKHMQAIREGAEDFQYFQMLRKRITALETRGVKGPALDAAKKLAVEGPERVGRELVMEHLDWWRTQWDRDIMDQVRIEVLEAMETLRGMK